MGLVHFVSLEALTTTLLPSKVKVTMVVLLLPHLQSSRLLTLKRSRGWQAGSSSIIIQTWLWGSNSSLEDFSIIASPEDPLPVRIHNIGEFLPLFVTLYQLPQSLSRSSQHAPETLPLVGTSVSHRSRGAISRPINRSIRSEGFFQLGGGQDQRRQPRWLAST